MSKVPLYTTLESVKVRLQNKVQFQRDPAAVQDGELSNDLFLQLIVDAETKVEQDLRSRYAIPFRSTRDGTFKNLPDHTQRALRTVVDKMAVMEVLNTDFGRGGHVDASLYVEGLMKDYEASIVKLLGRDPMGQNDKIDRFKFSPPLEDLLLAESNRFADDGFRGTICNSDASVNDPASFAQHAINDPSKAYPATRGPGGL